MLQLHADCTFLFSQDIADPFFAYCKQHADRFDRKWKRKNYLALQSNCKVSLLEREKQLTPEAQVGLSLSYQLQQPSVITVEYFHIQLNGCLLTAIELYSKCFGFFLMCLHRPESLPACSSTGQKLSFQGIPGLRLGCLGRSCHDL